MVSEEALATIIAPILTFFLGTFVGTFVEQHFARKTLQEQQRRTSYDTLFNRTEMILKGRLIEFGAAIRSNDYLKEIKRVARPLPFPNEAAAQKNYSLLPFKEREQLNMAYHRLRVAIDLVNKFGTDLDNREDAKQELKLALNEIEEQMKAALPSIDIAFEGNADSLEKIDDGDLLRAWRKLIREPWMKKYLPENFQKKGAAENKREKRRLLRH
jgi:hypothetical protein